VHLIRLLRSHRLKQSQYCGRVTNAGVHLDPARKADRISGWQLMKRLLADAGKPDKPGLYVTRACEYFWSTVPYLTHDQKRREDLDTHGPDHAADACRYGLLAESIARGVEISWSC
jgi:hypothetical protein